MLIPPDGNWPRDLFVTILSRLEYTFWAENPEPDHLFFVKGLPPRGDGRTHHVHVRPRAAAEAVIAFRDHLRSHAGTARAYQALKFELAARYPTDREAYTRGKDAFVANALADAHARRG